MVIESTISSVSAESNVTVQNGAQKFDATSVGYHGDNAKTQIQEIRLGGTATKLLFETGAKTATADGGR